MEVTDKKVIEETRKLFSDFLTQMGLDAEVKVEIVPAETGEDTKKAEMKNAETEEALHPSGPVYYVNVKLEGEHLNELVGYHGRNLEAAQTILGLMLSKRLDTKNYRLVLEINDYRERRESYLVSYAERAALQVRESGQELELPPMKPSERRVVHMALKKETGIISKSIGEGEERRIVVSKA